MNTDFGEVLSHWPAAAGADRVQQVAVSQDSYSDAEIWRVDVGQRSFALRNWRSSNDLSRAHTVQCHLACHTPALIPALELASDGSTIVVAGRDRFGRGGTIWDLSRWMSGAPVPRRNLSFNQLGSAMRSLARVHLGAMHDVSDEVRSGYPAFWTNREQYAKRHRHPLRSISTGMFTRVREIASIADSRVGSSWPDVWRSPEITALREAAELVQRAAQRFLPIIAPWELVELPLHPRHGDAQLGNFLFAGDNVSALIDFGAADLDCHAADVGRLLGTAVGDNVEQRTAALNIYESIRALSDQEREAVDIFDYGGVIVAASRWIGRLEPDRRHRHADAPVSRIDPAGLQRLCVLMERVRILAGATSPGTAGQSGTFA